MENTYVENLIRQLQEVQDGPNWLDESFKEKLEGVTEQQAFERPAAHVHSVAELISHLLVWRREAIRRLQGQDRALWMDSPENWKTNEQLRIVGWNALRSDFYRSQEDLVRVLQHQPDHYLEEPYSDGYARRYLVEGLLHHDLYHLGQLGITLKLLKQ